MDQSGLTIFDRLPSQIFAPLASANRHIYWDALTRLQGTFFGPDAPDYSEDGFLHRTITREIELFLTERDDWQEEDSSISTPISTRANTLLRYLLESGWLREERVGLRKMVFMAPTIEKFLETLQIFAEEGPKRLGGRVQSVYNNMVAIDKDPAGQAQVLPEAANHALNLVTTLRGMTFRVREVMESLNKHETTRGYIRDFFEQYISLFINDYRELRTDNHPLRHRHEIVQIAYRIRDESDVRQAILAEYKKEYGVSDPAKIERIFERDIARILKFQHIEKFLDRLDESINRAARQAYAYINYHLRTPSTLEKTLDKTIELLLSNGSAEVMTPFAAGPAFSQERLRPPRTKRAEPRIMPVQQPSLTPYQRASIELRHQMEEARQIAAPQVAEYLDQVVPAGKTVTCDALPVNTVKDLMVVGELSRLAFLASNRQTRQMRKLPGFGRLIEYEIEIENGITLTKFVEMPTFTIRRRGVE